MAFGFSQSKAVKVFFSHKEVDRTICTDIRDDLKREFGDDIDIFLSSDAKCIPGGEDWQAAIESNLRKADWLFFLYLNPRQVWDWCFYEAGMFLGSKDASDQRRRLVVLHPDGVAPPAPFAKIQTVGTKTAVIAEKLREIMKQSRSGRDKSDEYWRRIARPIAEAVQAAAIQFFDGRYQLKIECPMVPTPTDPLDFRVDMEGGKVRFNKDAQKLFEIGVEDGVNLRRFGENLSEKKGAPKEEWRRTFDFYALEVAAVGIRRDKHLGVAELQSFRLGEVGYRPIITGANLEKDGTVHLTLYLVKIPDSLDPRSANSFDTVYQSLSLGCLVRREVVERNGIKLDGLSTDDPIAKTVLLNIRHALESVIVDADNRGVTLERTREAFDGPMLEELKDLQGKWKDAYRAFGDATQTVDVENSKQLFTVLRYLNLQFLKLAEAQLKQLLEKVQLPPTNELTESAKKLLPSPTQVSADGLSVEQGMVVTDKPSSCSSDCAESGVGVIKKKALRRKAASENAGFDRTARRPIRPRKSR